MEFIVELLVEIVIEGTIAIGSEKKVPMPIRILCAIVEWMIFFGMGGLFIYMGYEATILNDTVATVALITIGGCMIIGGIFIVYKMFKKKHSKRIPLNCRK